MTDKPERPPKDFNKVWPKITDQEIAHFAATQGVWACFVICTFTVLNVVMGKIDYPDQTISMVPLGDAALYAVIGFGIHKKLKMAAIAGLVLYILEFLGRLLPLSIQTLISCIFAAFFILAFVNGIRGVYKWHSLRSCGMQKE